MVLGVNQQKNNKSITELQTGPPTVLHLKVGARVMCLSNIHRAAGVVNGSMGYVRGIHLALNNINDQTRLAADIIQVEYDN
ncbi:hypothetical protein BGZ76_004037, partial [Entomortierella beljakovae]